jgi:hypothetical protein
LAFIDSLTRPISWKEISMMLPNSTTSLIIIALYHCHSCHHRLLTSASLCFLMIKPASSLSVHKYSSCICVLTSCSPLLHIVPWSPNYSTSLFLVAIRTPLSFQHNTRTCHGIFNFKHFPVGFYSQILTNISISDHPPCWKHQCIMIINYI